jgi:zinc transporter, ZIP family
MSGESENVGIAFGVVIGSGLATAVGAAVVFIPSLVKLADGRVLAASLGFSAGVMIYVSFMEIIPKSQQSFKEGGGFSASSSCNLSSLCFFGGIIFMLVRIWCTFISVFSLLVKSHLYVYPFKLINSLINKIVSHSKRRDEILSQQKKSELIVRLGTDVGTGVPDCPVDRSCDHSVSSEGDFGCMCSPGCSSDPKNDLDFYQFVAANIVKKHMTYSREMKPAANEEKIEQRRQETPELSEENGSQKDTENCSMTKQYAQRKLMNMSLSTAIAIALHNFPEGLATFVAVLADPSIGVVFAVAIAIHNIPEGLCVALPVYYATGNRCKAFIWGMLSGITEPIAALFGWAVLSNSYSPTLFGVMFGLVAGMMVMISIRELIPTAHRYDPHDKLVTTSVIVGMLVMGLSLVLFRL